MSMEEILTDLRVPFLREGEHHHSRPGWLQMDCPFCGKDSHKFHLGYNIALKYFSCWKCRGHWIDKVLVALGATREMARLAAKDLNHPLYAGEVRNRERSRISLVVPGGIGPLLPAHRRYLRERGFDPSEVAKVWGVGGIGIAPKLAWRIYIPITQRGVQVSWTTRAIGDRVTQRYLSASAEQESVNHKHVVYGLDQCRHSVVIVEGPVDAWAVGPGGGATLGTAFTSSQVKELVKIPHRYICFDSSPDAQQDAEELAGQLSVFPGTTENIQLDAKDPGCASPKEIKLLRKVAGL